MTTLGEFLGNGQQRRQWLDNTIGGMLTNLTPPNLRPAAEFAAQMNPIQGMSDSMAQFGVATDPNQSPEARRSAAINSAVEALIAVAPAGLAAKGYMTPAQATMEGLLGGSPATQQIGDDLGRFWADEAGNIRVWHGSPHDFDKFSMEHIGTGEGAQAYGHGLYFAENADVAKGYAPRDFDAEEIMLSRYKQAEAVGDYDAMEAWEAAMLHQTPDELLATAGDVDLDEGTRAAYRAVSDEVRGMQGSGSHLYEVNIDANPEDFLDWDAPISDAPQDFQDLVKLRMDEVDLPEGSRRQRTLSAWRGAEGDWRPQDASGVPVPRVAEVRNWLWDYGGDQSRMTDELLGAGIPGISYLDAGSRGAGEGSRNYVVFDDSLLGILSKNGVKLGGK